MPSLTDFDPASLMLSIVTSAIGLALFVHGKKQERWPQLAAGVVFMVYPYFVSGPWAIFLVGALIGAGLWLALRMGW